MPTINLLNLGLNVSGSLLGAKRIAICDNDDLSKELFQAIPNEISKAAAVANNFIDLPSAYNVSEQTEYTEPKISRKKRASKHPVENGAQFTDYAVFEPITASMDIILPGGLGYGLPNLHADTVIKDLQAMYNNGQLCAIVTYGDVFKNMLLTSMPPVINARNYGRVQFSLKFEQILNPSLDAAALNENNIKEPFDAATKTLGKIGIKI